MTAGLLLATGALLTALEVPARDNAVVGLVTGVADALAGPLEELFQFRDRDRDAARTKQVLVGWGVAAILYLVVGRVLDAVIRR